MSIIGIGIDIVEINRIKKVYNCFKNKFAERILSKLEFKKYLFLKNKIKFLTKIFSLKEACSKALGTGIRKKVSFKNIEIYNNKLGKPKIRFLKNVLIFSKNMKVRKKYVSISYEKKYFCALVILEN
ncbi:holo-ACP synthase [Buchnera aphidicola]|uniref:holo-ACP synthase n=1 Tax=Buchnera aphidicola TaxID=9 RepID=UPI0031B84304